MCCSGPSPLTFISYMSLILFIFFNNFFQLLTCYFPMEFIKKFIFHYLFWDISFFDEDLVLFFRVGKLYHQTTNSGGS